MIYLRPIGFRAPSKRDRLYFEAQSHWNKRPSTISAISEKVSFDDAVRTSGTKRRNFINLTQILLDLVGKVLKHALVLLAAAP